MRTMDAGRLVLVCGGVLALAACRNDVTAPQPRIAVSAASASNSCGGLEPSRAPRAVGDPHALHGVTVRANFPQAGIPWNVLQQMTFPMWSGADRAPCLNSQFATYSVDTLTPDAATPLPIPDGVDPDFWVLLSPREQRVLLARAELYMQLYPGKYPTIGSAIDGIFSGKMLGAKAASKIRANDYQLDPGEGELLAGGIYGCLLYRSFVRDRDWIFSNDETLEIVSQLVAAFAEAKFFDRPLRGLQFGRNGVFGGAMAQSDGYGIDCGTLAFNSIPSGRISITDPYLLPRSNPPGTGVPQPPDPGGLPPGWYPY